MFDFDRNKLEEYIDKLSNPRVLIIGDTVYDYCVRKLPSNNDFKFNEHKDDCLKKDVLSVSEKEKFTCLARELNKRGIYMAGLDVVDGKILEVNVTSPCYFIREINNAFNIQFEKIIADEIFSLTDSKLFHKVL